METVEDRLLQIFANHGVRGELREGWLWFGADRPSLYCEFHRGDSPTGRISLQLDVHVALPDGRVIVEKFGCLGGTEAEASARAIAKFVTGDLHVLLNSFFIEEHVAPGCDDQIEVETWEIGGDAFTVYLGPVTREFVPRPDRPNAAEYADPGIPSELLDELQSMVGARVDDGDTHWVRCFHCRIEGLPDTTEVLWDNRVWPEAQQRIESLDWRSEDRYRSWRTFLVARRLRAAPTIASTVSTVDEAIECFVEQCATPDLSDQAHAHLLVRRGVDTALAWRVVTFVPLAFATLAFDQCDLPTEYVLLDDDARPVERRRLDSEPVYTAALASARRHGGRPDGHAVLTSVANCSAFADRLRQVRESDLNPGECRFEPAMVFASTLGESLPAKSSTAIRARRRARTRRTQTPWWCFWRR